MKRWIALALCALLAACGGHTSDEDEKSIEPVNCRAEPAKCT